MRSRELLKSKSIKVTPTRLALMDTLQEAKSPLTAEELHQNSRSGPGHCVSRPRKLS